MCEYQIFRKSMDLDNWNYFCGLNRNLFFMKSTTIILLLNLIFTNFIFSQTGKLNQIKHNLNHQQDINSYIEDVNDTSDKNPNSFHPFQDLFVQIMWNITYGVAIETIFEKESKMHRAAISKYPYIENKIGNYSYDDSLSVSYRFSVIDSWLRESTSLYGNNLNLQFRFAKRLDANLSYSELKEKTNFTTDNFSLFSAMLNYHRIRTQKLDLWYGLGIMHVANNVNKTGFAYGIGAEWFFKKPISLFASINSTVINQENLTKSKVLLKYYHKNTQFVGGYQKFKITTIGVDTFSLGLGYTF